MKQAICIIAATYAACLFVLWLHQEHKKIDDDDGDGKAIGPVQDKTKSRPPNYKLNK